jgi:hypothetical protein
MIKLNATTLERTATGVIRVLNGANIIGAFSSLSSLSIFRENNRPYGILIIDSAGQEFVIDVHQVTSINNSTTTLNFDPVDPTLTNEDYVNKVIACFNAISKNLTMGYPPGPTFVGGVVASYPSFASFPPIGTTSVIYIDESVPQAYIWDGTSYQLLVSQNVETYPNYASFPVTGVADVIYIDLATYTAYVYDAGAYHSMGGGTAVWGGITGTLSAQTDLQSALNAKYNNPTGTTSQYIRGDGSVATFPTIPGGTVTAVTATAPITSTGGTTPDIAMPSANSLTNGYLLSSDWLIFNGKFNTPTGTTLEYVRGDGSLATFPAIPTGTVTSVGTTGLISGGPITTSGTITTSMATNKLVGRSTAGTGIMEEITIGSGLTLTGGTLTNTATPTPLGYYGAWQDDNTQTAAASNTGYAMQFHTADVTPNGVSIVNDGSGNPTRITFSYTGIYNLQFSSQFQNIDSQLHDVTIWLRLNGTDVAGSSGFISVPDKHGVTNGHGMAAWNYVLDVVGGQYYELVWSTTSHTNVTMQYYAAGSPPPAAASVILTVTQQSGIMAGTGMTALNGLTGAVQTLATGTTGTDFGISSSGTTHTFNLPTASATNRGLLSTSDWTTFNNKFNSPSGTTLQYVRGDGSLATFPTIPTVTPSALTKTDDTNVTLTLGGTPSTALLQAVSLTLGWTGTLADSRIASASTWNAKQNALTRYVSTTDGTAVSSTTTITLTSSQLVPANTFSVGNVIRLNVRFLKATANASTSFLIYINTSASLTGATQLGVISTNNRTNGMKRDLYIKSATATQMYPTTGSAITDDAVQSSAPSSINIDWTTDKYIIFAIGHSGATDTGGLTSGYTIEKY